VLPQVSLVNRIAILILFLVVQINMNYVLFSTFNIVIKSLYPALQIIIMLAMVPLIKPPSAYQQSRKGDDEEIDYEALLSSSDQIPVGDITGHEPTYTHDRHGRFRRQRNFALRLDRNRCGGRGHSGSFRAL
jgi:hypothetical protein